MRYITDDQRATIQAILAAGGSIAVLSDIDGTICEMNLADPFAVFVDKKAKAALQRLSRLPQVKTGVLTGRDIKAAQSLVGLRGLLYIGNHGHGQTTAYPAKLDDVNFVPEVVPFKEKNRRLRQQAEKVLPKSVIIEDKGISLALNVGGCADQESTVKEIERDLRAFAERLGFKWTYDVTTVEFLPDVEDRDKGAALLDTVLSSKAKYVVFGGDSMTDLSALRAIKRLRAEGVDGIGVVAKRSTTKPELLKAADLQVPGVPGMAEFLTELAEVLGV